MILMCYCGKVKVAPPYRSSAVKKWLCDTHKQAQREIKQRFVKAQTKLDLIVKRNTKRT